jgi:hypothetical protein
MFAVLAFANAKGQPRTAGICYAVKDRQIFILTGKDTWKVKHIARNLAVSLTVTLPKQVPFLPWVQIPAATVTIQGQAEILGYADIPPDVFRTLTRGAEMPVPVEEIVAIKITPAGEFVTYGINVSLLTMRKPEEARGRAPVVSKLPTAA